MFSTVSEATGATGGGLFGTALLTPALPVELELSAILLSSLEIAGPELLPPAWLDLDGGGSSRSFARAAVKSASAALLPIDGSCAAAATGTFNVNSAIAPGGLAGAGAIGNGGLVCVTDVTRGSIIAVGPTLNRNITATSSTATAKPPKYSQLFRRFLSTMLSAKVRIEGASVVEIPPE